MKKQFIKPATEVLYCEALPLLSASAPTTTGGADDSDNPDINIDTSASDDGTDLSKSYNLWNEW